MLSAHTIHALCRMLFHSLWIGLAVAILTGIVITLTSRSSPRLRYNLFCGLLVLFVLGTGLAFFWEWGTFNVSTTTSSVGQFNLAAPKFPAGIVVIEKWTSGLDRWSAWIVGTWLLCAALKSIKLTGELIYLRQLRRTGLSGVSAYWQGKTTAFAARFGIGKKIRILESALVSVPVTIGYFRPLILLPVGVLLQLSPDQVESILYHELAHILRRDYLVNILQSILEAVFFFNPAICWLSALIREEREACCDELVLTQVPQKSAYLEALMVFQQGAPRPAKLAMGLLRRPQLLNRLRRMVSHENRQLNAAEKIVLLASFVLLLIFTFVPKANLAASKGTAFVSRHVVDAVQHLSQGDLVKELVTVHHQPLPKATEISAASQKVSADTIKRLSVRPKVVNVEPKFHPAETGFAAAKERARGIINALISEKVVTSQADIEWFGLSADELIVNGIKQPEALHQKLRETFGVEPGNGVFYGPVKMNGKGDFLNKEDL